MLRVPSRAQIDRQEEGFSQIGVGGDTMTKMVILLAWLVVCISFPLSIEREKG